VNCGESGQGNNHIHIYLGMTPDEDDRCESVNAEISPHFRRMRGLRSSDLRSTRTVLCASRASFSSMRATSRIERRQTREAVGG
jgi:hypothetical protein